MAYKVENLMGDTWQVIEVPEDIDVYRECGAMMIYQGSLSDCEAYIRLHEGGYM